MNAADNTRYSKSEIAAEIKTQLAALKLADEETPAFERIELFDVESLTDAFKLLIISEDRICIIVMLDESFETLVEGQKLAVTRQQPVALLISDAVIGDRNQALWGDPESDTQNGAFALAELALTALTGQLLAADSEANKVGVIAKPFLCNSIFLKDTDRQDLPGRAAVALEFHCEGGTLEAELGVGPNL